MKLKAYFLLIMPFALISNALYCRLSKPLSATVVAGIAAAALYKFQDIVAYPNTNFASSTRDTFLQQNKDKISSEVQEKKQRFAAMLKNQLENEAEHKEQIRKERCTALPKELSDLEVFEKILDDQQITRIYFYIIVIEAGRFRDPTYSINSCYVMINDQEVPFEVPHTLESQLLLKCKRDKNKGFIDIRGLLDCVRIKKSNLYSEYEKNKCSVKEEKDTMNPSGDDKRPRSYYGDSVGVRPGLHGVR